MSVEVPNGGLILSREEVRMLYQVANLKDLRAKLRDSGTGTAAYKLIHELSRATFANSADNGITPRQTTAIRDNGYTTVVQVAHNAGISERTVRLHLQQQILPATKSGRHWIITQDDADTYISARRKN
ncbi:helix-turn-helix domain-containing protein [Microbacterium sp. HMH0099]|uniref:helix-turn-helix domain-containing protein n=1 Tax=Microbacterium sp. HMH0099 TaxID=3414026 RepID=UPI003BF62BCA